jgi:hypothetical protein
MRYTTGMTWTQVSPVASRYKYITTESQSAQRVF